MSNMNKEEFQTYIRAELQKPRGPDICLEFFFIHIAHFFSFFA